MKKGKLLNNQEIWSDTEGYREGRGEYCYCIWGIIEWIFYYNGMKNWFYLFYDEKAV